MSRRRRGASWSAAATRAINVVVDTDQLAAYGLSVEDVRQALRAQNLEVPGGTSTRARASWCCARWAGCRRPREFNELIVANRDGYPIRVKDIGRAEDSIEEPRGLARLDGAERGQPDRAEAVGHQHRQGRRRRQGAAGDDRQARCRPTSRSRSSTTSRGSSSKSIEEVKFHLLLAGVLVSLTILLFIRDWRTTLIATLAIPTSIMPPSCS